MNNFQQADEKMKEARAVVNALPFGTKEWEAAMQIVRNLAEQANAADNAILNHRCDFSR